MLLKEATLIYKTRRVDGKRPKVMSARDAYDLLRDRALASSRETFWTLYLDATHRLIAIETVAIGSADGVEVYPREVFRGAIIAGAVAVIVAHNHPSGDETPSINDILLTRQLKEAGDILYIKVIDHIVIGDDTFQCVRTEEENS